MKYTFPLSVVLLFSLSLGVGGGGGKGPLPNAFIRDSDWEGGLRYTDGPEFWSDVPSLLLTNGMKELLHLCVTGSFLIYSGHNDGELYFQNEVKLFSGLEVCSDVGWKQVKSIQLASSFDSIYTPSIVLFKESLLRGRSFPVSRGVKRLNEVIQWRVSSFIIHGKMGWTVVTGDGRKFCLQPKFLQTSKFPICLLLDRQYKFQDKEWISIYKGCQDKEISQTIYVSHCYEFGVGRPETIQNETGSGGFVPGDNFLKDCDENDDFLTLLDLRLNNDFKSEYQMRLPKSKNLAWRTELVDTSFEILMATCPPALLSPEYLSMLREIYIFKAEKFIWSKGQGWPNKETKEVKLMVKETDDCLLKIKSRPHDRRVVNLLQENLMESYLNLHIPKYNQSHIRPEFVKKSGLDLVMESLWLVANHVAATCHLTFEFQTNYWTDFYLIFRDMYLTPLLNHWDDAGKFDDYYPLLLGGFDIEKQFQSLASCVSNTFDLQPTLDPFERPTLHEPRSTTTAPPPE